MRCDLRRWAAFGLAVLLLSVPLCAEQDPFRWMDFHAEKDQDIVVWVTRALATENWSAIREIGVRWDAALVITTLRATPQSVPGTDTFAIYSVSLTNHAVTLLLRGANLRHLDYMHFAPSATEEPAILFDNCANCAADTYLTSFYYDPHQHMWGARWLRGNQAVPLWTASTPPGIEWTQIYAAMAARGC